mgnify:CR=1 FL=1
MSDNINPQTERWQKNHDTLLANNLNASESALTLCADQGGVKICAAKGVNIVGDLTVTGSFPQTNVLVADVANLLRVDADVDYSSSAWQAAHGPGVAVHADCGITFGDISKEGALLICPQYGNGRTGMGTYRMQDDGQGNLVWTNISEIV